ncbi:MAG TPA: hypothetical protein VFZ14_03175 [Burkholderiales bacterium]|nr:hypothetical protein [Burkholderiales bacterium]
MKKATPLLYAASVAVLVAAGLSAWDTSQADSNKHPKTPTYRVDPLWPKVPLPSDPATGKPWVTGEVAGTCVDSADNVFIVTRGNLVAPETVEAVAAPPVIEFNPEGDVVASWGDRAVLPNGIHGCFVDYQDNVWIAGNGDGIVQKYSHSGTLLLQIGTRGVCDNPPANTCGNSGSNPLANQSHTLLNQPADMYVDPNPDPVTGKRGSIYIADGYGNHRVAVFDSDGNFLRQWGSVAGTVVNPLTDSPGAFASGDGGHPHCVLVGNDGLVYACDRADDRIQVYTRTGQLVRIIPVVPGTGVTGAAPLGTAGSAWDFDFSNDGVQSFLFEADGGNERVHIMDRFAGSILASFGQPGHQAGQFTFLHTIAKDSKGNLYTGETINGRRVQKFVHTECNNGNGRGNGNGRCQ